MRKVLSREQRGRIARLLSGGFLGRAAEVEAQALALLTEEQQEQFRKMRGPQFQRNPRGQN